MAAPAIRVEGLGKRYRLAGGHGRAAYRTLRESLADLVKAPFRKKAPAEEFWALSDVSFDVRPGEVIGIIGRNGAGKSTLLKILSRITKPTTGRVEINGRVGSLLEVGTGFHPELTGRENIYLNGSILGMSRKEIDRKFDEIVAFAEVEKFLDTPVKRYSSGMYVRLAFAVAAHLEPEILIVDEVLAVGDQAFQRKCIQQMGEVAQGGRTILLVSHDLPMVQKLSSRAVWIRSGRIHQVGTPADVIAGYQTDSARAFDQAVDIDLANCATRTPGSAPLLQRLRLTDGRGQLITGLPLGGELWIEIDYRSHLLSAEPTMALDVCDVMGSPIGQLNTLVQPVHGTIAPGLGTLRCRISPLMLLPGEYVLHVRYGDPEGWLDVVMDAVRFTVFPSNYLGPGRLPLRKHGVVVFDADWFGEGGEPGSHPANRRGAAEATAADSGAVPPGGD